MRHITIYECYDKLNIGKNSSEMSITYEEVEELERYIINEMFQTEDIINTMEEMKQKECEINDLVKTVKATVSSNFLEGMNLYLIDSSSNLIYKIPIPISSSVRGFSDKIFSRTL